jgi:tetratricopeptide (TPR) repeat protein
MSGPAGQLEAMLEGAAQAETRGQGERALAEYGAARDKWPTDPRPYKAICALLRKLGRRQEAESCARAFAVALPDDPAAHLELGVSLISMRRFGEAALALERALALRPAFQAAWSYMGIAMAHQGDLEQAMRCYERASGKAPSLSVPDGPSEKGPAVGRTGFERALHEALAGPLEAGGGCVQLLSESRFAFKASVALLVILVRDYDMDGVVVSVAKPSEMYRRVLERRMAVRHPPYYLEVQASPVDAGGGSADRVELSAFELDRIDAAVRLGLHRVAEKYGGEHHFVLLDDLTAIGAYNGPAVVQRFVSRFFGELSALNIFCFVVLPETSAGGLLGALGFSRTERIRVRSEWFAWG